MSVLKLSPAQREAVHHIATPTIIAAGAGSGKTRTLTAKIAHLVGDLGYDPGRILAITFTNKAAAEMKSRLSLVTGMPMGRFPWVRTFHSACFRVLKEHCDLLGYRKPLLIHDDTQQKGHLKKVLAELDLDRKYLQGAMAMISHAKNSGAPMAFIRASAKVPRKTEIFTLYNEMLERSNSVDFDDILLLTRDLFLKFPEIRAHYQNTFDHILVDEFQDSNSIQNEVIDLLLTNGNLTVVGDDYQSIYKFRGADPAHFINFPEKYRDAKVFRLEENYRSTSEIVAASDHLIAHNASRIDKTCFSRRPGASIVLEAFPDDAEEARWVAEKCWHYTAYKKIPPEQIAILYRTKFTSLSFERALRYARIPYAMMGAQGFFKRREVQDINSYLISAVNPSDDISFERILNVPKRGIGPAAVKNILANRPEDASLQESCRHAVTKGFLPKKASAKLRDLLELLEQIAELPPAEAMRHVVDGVEYGSYLRGVSENQEDFDSRVENIQQMIADASRAAEIIDYLEDAQLIREDQDESDERLGIRLSTIHAAKGLEFKVVFVVALEERILPHHRSIGNDDDASLEGIEEERRLMYVAMTRASDFLHLSWSRFRKNETMARSRFIKEIPPQYLSADG
ncbi:MAG: ATP-dependent helicase [Syntrophobacteraceae bacterium]